MILTVSARIHSILYFTTTPGSPYRKGKTDTGCDDTDLPAYYYTESQQAYQEGSPIS
jgi:hypothetical protein